MTKRKSKTRKIDGVKYICYEGSKTWIEVKND